MGKSQTIADKEREDAEFRAFMKKLETESKSKEEEMLGQISKNAKEFYENNKWEYSRFFGNRQSDYQNYSDWSLTRVQEIIKSIGDAIAAANFPSKAVPGSEDASDDTTDKVKANLPSFIADINLTITRVVALLNGFLTQFGSTSSVSQKSAFQDLPLSGGIHLFLSQNGSVYQEKRFFSNQFIGSFQIVFEAYMSVSEAKAYSIIEIIKTTQIEINMINTQILEIRQFQNEALKKLLNDPKLYKETKLAFDEMIDMQKISRDELIKEFDKYKFVYDLVSSLQTEIEIIDQNIIIFDQETKNKILLSDLLNDWEVKLATRIIRERANA